MTVFTALTATEQALVDEFVPAASVVDVMDPAVEAKGRALSVGVEDATGLALPADLAPAGVSWVWVVVGGTHAHAFTAVVCTDETRAWNTARDLVRHSRGVRVERHPLL